MKTAGAHRVRAAAPDDWSAIARTHQQCWMEAYRGHLPDRVIDGRKGPEFETLWEQRVLSSNEGPVCVAEDPEGTIAGFASGGPLRADLPGYDGELVTFYVVADSQGRGLGTEMFAFIFAGMKSARYRYLVAQVLASTPAGGFYRRLGGHVVEQRHFDYRGVGVSANYFA